MSAYAKNKMAGISFKFKCKLVKRDMFPSLMSMSDIIMLHKCRVSSSHSSNMEMSHTGQS